MVMDLLNDNGATATMEYENQALATLSQVRDLLAQWNAGTEVETAGGYLRRIQAVLGDPAPQCPLEATHTYFTGTCLHCGQPCGPADVARACGR